MKTSEQINELASALAKAQGAIKNASKDSDNPFFKSKYADLAAVWEACRSELSTNGLSVSQVPELTDGKVSVHTMLMHASGQWISGELAMAPVKSDPQGIGSCLTYIRRYALSAIVGIAPEDDDGNAASGNGKNGHAAIQNVERTKEAIPLDQAHLILPDDDKLINTEQAKKLHMRFKDELREELKPHADRFLQDFLASKLYLDAAGNPSAKAVPKEQFAAVGKEAVSYARGL